MYLNDYLNGLAQNDDEKRLIGRLRDQLDKADKSGLTLQSDFLDLHQQEIAGAVAAGESDIIWHMEGGYEEAERKRLIVSPEWKSGVDTGIAYLRITHKEIKGQSIGHRDYLGAILNLGINRGKLGDIIVQNEAAYVLADINLADYICQQLSKVGHNSVSVERISAEELIYDPPQLTELKTSLASLRIDAAIAAAFNLSRSDVNTFIDNGNVKLNQMDIYKSAASVKAGDLISVRGLGRFRLEEIGGISRKGRYHVLISRW